MSTKHGLAAGAQGRPDSADWTVPQHWERYTEQDHATWKTLFERQARLLPGRACDEFLRGLKDLPLDAERIPDFRRLNEVIERRTGWQIVAVPGLVPDEVFFGGASPLAASFARPSSWTTCKSPMCSTTCLGTCPCSCTRSWPTLFRPMASVV